MAAQTINFIFKQPDAEIKTLLAQLKDVPVESSLRDIYGGFAFCYLIKSGERALGLEICRVDVNHKGEREFVILHTIKAPDYNLEIDFFDILDAGEKKIAPAWGCDLIRRHADRAGMIEFLEKYDYIITEVVLKRDLRCPKKKVNQVLRRRVQPPPQTRI